SNYPFGAGLGQVSVPGIKPAKIVNPDLHWEESEQTDVGLDFSFLNNAITFSADYFYKRTKDMLIEMPLAGFVGEVAPMGNVGTMENRGVEFEASYRWRVDDWNFRVAANASWLQNKLINLGNASGFRTVESAQGIGEMVRGTNGLPYPYFYGYKSDGIFQNYDEINSYVNERGELIQPNAVPGDVRWVDVNHDGKIDGDDQDMIGKGTPDWTYGFSLNVEWRGFDFSAVCQGVTGNDIFDASRRTDITSANLPTWMLNRWTGEGTSNRYPRYTANDQVNWSKSSDLYLTDGSYFRLKNITLGYTLPSHITRKAFVQNFRVYVMAENLLTATKYAGFDPEVTNGSSLGVDRGVYPQSKVWTIGCNITF
ncbi:MAG: TonB-dependent receptor, partial [Muribaculaceae bacterium]|nr:TonB-dependent receptor [Muribaculaceae bacterium]